MMNKDIQDSIVNSSKIIENISQNVSAIEQVILEITFSIKNGNKLVIFGNGGSAADAQHIAAEMIGRFGLERRSYPAIALTTDSSILTALSNDYAFDLVFSRQCEGLVKKRDIVLGISTSGNSKNVANGLSTAKKIGAKTISLTGNDGGILKDVADISIIVDSNITPRIQEAHRVIYHIICDMVEKNLEGKL